MKIKLTYDQRRILERLFDTANVAEHNNTIVKIEFADEKATLATDRDSEATITLPD